MPWTIPCCRCRSRARGHLAVHHEPLAIEFVEALPVRPFRNDVGIGDENARRIVMRRENADRLARLDEQGLVVLDPLEGLDDLVEHCPVARGAADPAVNDQTLRVLGDLLVEIVHQHSHCGFGGPVLATSSLPRRARMCRLLSRRSVSCPLHRKSAVPVPAGRPSSPARPEIRFARRRGPPPCRLQCCRPHEPNQARERH